MTLSTEWFNDHYEYQGIGERALCRRCGNAVGYVTKHAAKRHGDPIEILPPAPSASPETVKAW